ASSRAALRRISCGMGYLDPFPGFPVTSEVDLLELRYGAFVDGQMLLAWIPFTRRDDRFDMTCNVGQRRKPDPALVPHVSNKIDDRVEARESGADEGVPHTDPQSTVQPSRIKFGTKHLHGARWRRYRHHEAEVAVVHVMRPVIQGPIHGQLEKRAGFVVQPIGDLV